MIAAIWETRGTTKVVRTPRSDNTKEITASTFVVGLVARCFVILFSVIAPASKMRPFPGKYGNGRQMVAVSD
jgi:hypothetical protein